MHELNHPSAVVYDHVEVALECNSPPDSGLLALMQFLGLLHISLHSFVFIAAIVWEPDRNFPNEDIAGCRKLSGSLYLAISSGADAQVFNVQEIKKRQE
ncbi:hypothetical protein HY407_00480 [Candidatus Gottesmanbacteria bacterium]|nr:hypothetical protein [Candidatus Gottesmanbacteria bacterium]